MNKLSKKLVTIALLLFPIIFAIDFMAYVIFGFPIIGTPYTAERITGGMVVSTICGFLATFLHLP